MVAKNTSDGKSKPAEAALRRPPPAAVADLVP